MSLRGIEIEGRVVAGEVSPGPAPMLRWVDVADLVIDDDYQRPLLRGNWAAIQRIADNFCWSRFAPVLVAPVEGGRFALIDGQHRAHAAAICGIGQVPAMVVTVARAEQARSFAWINGQTIRVSPHGVFKSALVSGEDWAVRAEAAVAAAGCRLMTYNASAAHKLPGQVYCVSLVRKFAEAGMDAAITAGLAALTRAPATHRVVFYSDAFLRDWVPAVHLSMVRDADTLAAALAVRNPWKVLEDATASGLSGGPRERCRKALVAVIMGAVKARAVA